MRGRVVIDDGVRRLINEAAKIVGSKSRLAYRFGYRCTTTTVNNWLSGKVKTIPVEVYEGLVKIVEGKEE